MRRRFGAQACTSPAPGCPSGGCSRSGQRGASSRRTGSSPGFRPWCGPASGGSDPMMKSTYAKASLRACPHPSWWTPFTAFRTARAGEAHRLEQTLTQKNVRGGQLIQGPEPRRPRQQEVCPPFTPSDPTPVPPSLAGGLADAHPCAGPTAAAPRNRGLINAEAARRRRLPGAQTLRRWRPALLARWPRGQRFTNGYIEGCHTKLKRQKRRSYGFRKRNR